MPNEQVTPPIQPSPRRAPVLARQFGHPTGPLGQLVGRLMARGNGPLNTWIVERAAERSGTQIERIVEIGPGPGIGLTHILATYPTARVYGIDLSATMLKQAARRNAAQVQAGRLALIHGDTTALQTLAPVDLILAVHVLYFWHTPDVELQRLHHALRDGGTLALGYQLRRSMPPPAQKAFPRAGDILYDADDQLETLVRDAGFSDFAVLVEGPADAPHGRLALATK